jgi:hypothetical protein
MKLLGNCRLEADSVLASPAGRSPAMSPLRESTAKAAAAIWRLSLG